MKRSVGFSTLLLLVLLSGCAQAEMPTAPAPDAAKPTVSVDPSAVTTSTASPSVQPPTSPTSPPNTPTVTSPAPTQDPDLVLADISDRVGQVLDVHTRRLARKPQRIITITQSGMPAPLSAAALSAVTTDMFTDRDFWTSAPAPAIAGHGQVVVTVVFDGSRWGLSLDGTDRPMCLKIDDTSVAAQQLSVGACPPKQIVKAEDWIVQSRSLKR